MTTIRINASRQYNVVVDAGLLDSLGGYARELIRGHVALVVSDTNVAPLYMERALASLRNVGIECDSYIVPAGEHSKSGETYLALMEALAERRLTRADVLIALGGGVIGDLTGFAAASYLRGIGFIQVPTTLLSCVDSSVGGKTAIDLRAGKNLVGAFYQPLLVLCDPQLLDTLPDSEFACGMAEVIKEGMINRPELSKRLLERSAREQLEYIITECVSMKRDIVEEDEFDTGARQLLNLGHTFAHSVEALSDYTVPHGRAVAIGLALITRAAVRKGLCPAPVLDVLCALLEKNSLPDCTNYSAADLADRALNDKKRAGDTVTLVVPTGAGKSELKPIPVGELRDWAEAGLKP